MTERSKAPDGVVDHERAINEFVGAVILRRRNELGYTLARVAEMMGLSYQQIQKYEKGRNSLASVRLERMAEVLQIPVGGFFPSSLESTKEPFVSLSDRLAKQMSSLDQAGQEAAFEMMSVVIQGLKDKKAA